MLTIEERKKTDHFEPGTAIKPFPAMTVNIVLLQVKPDINIYRIRKYTIICSDIKSDQTFPALCQLE